MAQADDRLKNVKFIKGEEARQAWSKAHLFDDEMLQMSYFNEMTNNAFSLKGNLVLDDTNRRQTTLMVDVVCDPEDWKEKTERIYTLVRNGEIAKIGGTRNGMKDRWGSYLCGFHVAQRGKKGTCSVTNAYLYHTIEEDLLAGNTWEVWAWAIPPAIVSVSIFGEDVDVQAQVFHAYETKCIMLCREHVGAFPPLCFNRDRKYDD